MYQKREHLPYSIDRFTCYRYTSTLQKYLNKLQRFTRLDFNRWVTPYYFTGIRMTNVLSWNVILVFILILILCSCTKTVTVSDFIHTQDYDKLTWEPASYARLVPFSRYSCVTRFHLVLLQKYEASDKDLNITKSTIQPRA